jgi:hypothetical protein
VREELGYGIILAILFSLLPPLIYQIKKNGMPKIIFMKRSLIFKVIQNVFIIPSPVWPPEATRYLEYARVRKLRKRSK